METHSRMPLRRCLDLLPSADDQQTGSTKIPIHPENPRPPQTDWLNARVSKQLPRDSLAACDGDPQRRSRRSSTLCQRDPCRRAFAWNSVQKRTARRLQVCHPIRRAVQVVQRMPCNQARLRPPPDTPSSPCLRLSRERPSRQTAVTPRSTRQSGRSGSPFPTQSIQADAFSSKILWLNHPPFEGHGRVSRQPARHRPDRRPEPDEPVRPASAWTDMARFAETGSPMTTNNSISFNT